jgi:hypothetical protein
VFSEDQALARFHSTPQHRLLRFHLFASLDTLTLSECTTNASTACRVVQPPHFKVRKVTEITLVKPSVESSEDKKLGIIHQIADAPISPAL